MSYTLKEVLDFVEDNDVKFIRLAFCDLFGMQKQISIMPGELTKAFSTGISFDASAIKGFEDVTRSDLFLVPDPDTLSLLPWRPQQGRVARFLCDIKNPDGTPYFCDTRNLLKDAVKRCTSMGYECMIGAECEFYLFKTDEFGHPTPVTHDQGGYLDIAPLDKGENIRREICLTLEELGILPESSHHEQGPGQNEIDFKYSDALSAADNFVTYKSVIKAIAAKNGLYASFMPKPLKNYSGSGLHINISLFKNNKNIFNSLEVKPDDPASKFLAGVLERIREMSVFLNPTVNSYDRLGSFEAPKYISWSRQNRSQLIRIPAESGDQSRMELRSPDPSVNPYIAFALILNAGLDGIEKDLELCSPLDINLYKEDVLALKNIDMLPNNLMDSLMESKNSEFISRVLGEVTREKYLDVKQNEFKEYTLSLDQDSFYRDHYFNVL